MLTNIVLQFLILKTFVMAAMCTVCPREHPQHYFCSSRIVLNLQIVSKLKYAAGYGYKALIKEIYRDVAKTLNPTSNEVTVEILTNPNFALGEEYIIFGRNKEGRIYTEECKGNVAYAETSEYHKNLLKKHYNENCNCVNAFGSFSDERICYWNYSYKIFHGRSCKWHKSEELISCEMNAYN